MGAFIDASSAAGAVTFQFSSWHLHGGTLDTRECKDLHKELIKVTEASRALAFCQGSSLDPESAKKSHLAFILGKAVLASCSVPNALKDNWAAMLRALDQAEQASRKVRMP